MFFNLLQYIFNYKLYTKVILGQLESLIQYMLSNVTPSQVYGGKYTSMWDLAKWIEVSFPVIKNE